MPLWGNKDQSNNKPTFAQANNSSWYGNCYGVSVDEMNIPGSVPVAQPGWVGVKSYTDCHGHTRYKTEVLVALSTMTGDNPADDTFFSSVAR